jgi:hypothetical protein
MPLRDAVELCDVAGLPPVEVEDPDGFEWPEDAQTDAERATHLAEVVGAHLMLGDDEVAAYRAWLLSIAERLDKLEHAL